MIVALVNELKPVHPYLIHLDGEDKEMIWGRSWKDNTKLWFLKDCGWKIGEVFNANPEH